jgi:hypothetical protein
MVQAVPHLIGDCSLGGDSGELVFKPHLEGDDERSAPFLADRAAFIGAQAADRLLDRVKRRDSFERFARYRCIPALGDVEEPATQVRPAESQCDRLAGGLVGNGFVGRVAVAWDDAAIAIEQLGAALAKTLI